MTKFRALTPAPAEPVEPVKPRRGRPPGKTPPKSNTERSRARRQRLAGALMPLSCDITAEARAALELLTADGTSQGAAVSDALVRRARTKKKRPA